LFTFKYRARNNLSGKEEKGTLIAESETDALSNLQQENLFVVDIRKLSAIESFDLNSILPVSLSDMEEFYRQMAFLLEAGIPLDTSLKSYAKQIKHKGFRDAILSIVKGLGEGVRFSEGLRKYPRIFPPVTVSMVLVAESDGNYEETFMNLADYFKRVREMRSKLMSAISYPIFILVAAIGVAMYLGSAIIPQIADSLKDSGAELPTMTKIVLAFSENLVLTSIVLIVSVVTVVASWIIARKNIEIKAKTDKWLLKVPLIGKVLSELFQARFCDSTSTLLSGGLPISKAIAIAGDIMSNEAMKRVILLAGEELKQGKKLSRTLEESTLFSDSLVLNTAVGEQTGRIDEAFKLLAKKYETQTDQLIGRLIKVITPASILVLSFMVGFIVIALFSAIGTLMTAY
jgi:type II secretory pathway component PulF